MRYNCAYKVTWLLSKVKEVIQVDDSMKIKKKHKGIKILMTVIAVIAIIIIGGAFYLATHTQIVIDIIQK